MHTIVPPSIPSQPHPDDVPLFDGFEPPDHNEPEPVNHSISPDRRRTLRQAKQVASGIHPLTRTVLHSLASRHRDSSSPKNDPFTCGSCWFRTTVSYHNGSYPKCLFGMTNETSLSGAPRLTHGGGSDVRAWWPACPDYSPSDSLSPDAARGIPEVRA